MSVLARRKKAQVEAQIDELGMDALQERLESAAQIPAQPPYQLSSLIQVYKASAHGWDALHACMEQDSSFLLTFLLCRIYGCKGGDQCLSWRLQSLLLHLPQRMLGVWQSKYVALPRNNDIF
jgi:hypothetical protein